MVAAQDAREWAAGGGLHGIGDSLYTPFCGPDGEEVDYQAYRWLVRYVVGDLQRPMLWTTSGVGEWWALTLDERKKLLEATVEEARRINPDVVIQANTQATGPKDTVELTRHAQQAGADICFLQTPPVEAMGIDGVLAYYRYIADRTDIALGIFNTPSSGLVLSGADMARIHHEIPAVVALKEGVNDSTVRSVSCKSLAPGMQIWECDPIATQAGWARDGIIAKSVFGGVTYLMETKANPMQSTYWKLLWEDRFQEAEEYARSSGMAGLGAEVSRWFNYHPSRPDYMFHWGSAGKFMASLIGLPVGDYPHARAPQLPVMEEAAVQIRAAYEKYGLAGAVECELNTMAR